MSDPIVDEVRRIRHAHAARFNFDLRAICDDLRKKEKTCGHPLVTLPPKRFVGATGSQQPHRTASRVTHEK